MSMKDTYQLSFPFINKKTGAHYYVDPSVSDYLLMDYVQLSLRIAE